MRANRDMVSPCAEAAGRCRPSASSRSRIPVATASENRKRRIGIPAPPAAGLVQLARNFAAIPGNVDQRLQTLDEAGIAAVAREQEAQHLRQLEYPPPYRHA